MSKKTPFPSRRRTGIATPQGLKPFNLTATRERPQEAPAGDADERGDALTLVSAADWALPSTPGYEVSGKDAERRGRLQYLIAKVKSGETVKIKDIRSAITAVEWEQYQAAVHQPRIRPVPRRISSMFKEYNALLRKADKLAQKAADGRPSRSVKRRHFGPIRERSFHEQAESHYEYALELLRDLIDSNPGIVAYLDRRYSEDTATLEPEGVPRLITSRSQYALEGGKAKQTKRNLQLSTLEASLRTLDALRETDHCKGAGIGTAPVIPGIEDQWIIVDGEGRVV